MWCSPPSSSVLAFCSEPNLGYQQTCSQGSGRWESSSSIWATSTHRNGQQSVLALDLTALMDALGIEKAILAGYDWGARTANIIAALWPERCKALVSVSGYLIGSPEANKMPLPPEAELQWWYQYYFATERDRAGYEKYRHDLPSSSGRSPRRSGISTIPRSIAAQRPSRIRIMSAS
jgi:pimeloyl-ACP methyl ester carboxylesterase